MKLTKAQEQAIDRGASSPKNRDLHLEFQRAALKLEIELKALHARLDKLSSS